MASLLFIEVTSSVFSQDNLKNKDYNLQKRGLKKLPAQGATLVLNDTGQYRL